MPTILHSIDAFRRTGVQRSLVAYQCVNFFTYPEAFSDCLDKYYLLYWSPEYFISQMSYGTITHNNEKYIVIYKHCTPTQIKTARQVKLSFRKPLDIFNLPGYVLVTVCN